MSARHWMRKHKSRSPKHQRLWLRAPRSGVLTGVLRKKDGPSRSPASRFHLILFWVERPVGRPRVWWGNNEWHWPLLQAIWRPAGFKLVTLKQMPSRVGPERAERAWYGLAPWPSAEDGVERSRQRVVGAAAETTQRIDLAPTQRRSASSAVT